VPRCWSRGDSNCRSSLWFLALTKGSKSQRGHCTEGDQRIVLRAICRQIPVENGRTSVSFQKEEKTQKGPAVRIPFAPPTRQCEPPLCMQRTERYRHRSGALTDDIDIHFHPTCVTPFCLVFRRRQEDHCVSRDRNEFDVFTDIGETREKARPVASIVRLCALDHCDVFGTDAAKITGPVFPKVICTAFDWKLKASRDFLLRRIESRERGDQIIEGRSQVLHDIIDDNLELLHQRGTANRRSRSLFVGASLVGSPGSFVVSNKGSKGDYAIKSNAVRVPIGEFRSVVPGVPRARP